VIDPVALLSQETIGRKHKKYLVEIILQKIKGESNTKKKIIRNNYWKKTQKIFGFTKKKKK